MLINLISYLVQNGEKMSSNVLFGPQLKYIFKISTKCVIIITPLIKHWINHNIKLDMTLKKVS